MQAQEPATPYVALWNRVADFDPAELDRAFADRTVVKATLLRITPHAVHTLDYPEIHHAVLPTLRAAGSPTAASARPACPSPMPTR